MPHKQDFSPMLPPGIHKASLADLRGRCVSEFPLSSTRDKIMTGLEAIVRILVRNNMDVDLLIDGGDRPPASLNLRPHCGQVQIVRGSAIPPSWAAPPRDVNAAPIPSTFPRL